MSYTDKDGWPMPAVFTAILKNAISIKGFN